ncbi:MAG: RDD family protein [Flammeovirgaceae bacterium]|jgi:uncharacterized RDD family membrane protein YckC|nr:RDD family protein [Flammeovirgaceae bacterium]|tara:strand:+ start:129332 stop:129835 length:504 start_codon:yes stop_codon:yes gene_type:complete
MKDPVQHHFANFWIRSLAYLLDTFVLQFLQTIVIIPFVASLGIPFVDTPFDIEAYGAVDDTFIIDFTEWVVQAKPIILAGFITQTLYFSLLESSHFQASLGKMALGIKVINKQGDRLTFLAALIRNAGKFLSGTLLMGGYIMAAFTGKKQALHDIIAGAYLIRPARD